MIGKAWFNGAICWINKPTTVGLTISARSYGDRFLLFIVDNFSRIFLKSLIGILSDNKDLSTVVRIFKGKIFGTV